MDAIEKRIRDIIEEELPIVNVDSEFLFTELDSLGITTILMLLSEEYGIKLEAVDVTPMNFKSTSALAQMVKNRLANK